MRVKDKSLNQYPFWLRPFFWSQKRRYGQVLLPGKIWGRVPRLFASVALLYGALDSRRAAVSPVIRSLVTVRVSQINHCTFCVDINAATLVKRCGSEEKVSVLANWRDESVFDDQERAVLDYVEAITDSHQQVTDAQVEQLRTWYNDDGIVELTGLIAFQNLSSKFNAALDIEPQGFCAVPGIQPDKSA